LSPRIFSAGIPPSSNRFSRFFFAVSFAQEIRKTSRSTSGVIIVKVVVVTMCVLSSLSFARELKSEKICALLQKKTHKIKKKIHDAGCS
jgi:hypothetical protein